MTNISRFVSLALVPLASFLTFLIQPIAGKSLLFAYGGQASVWLTAILFFQCILLAGYVLAGLLEKASRLVQAATVIGITALAILTLDTRPGSGNSEFTQVNLVFSLLTGLGPAMLVTTSIGILMHGWLRALNQPIPYFLYSVSNLGSIAALALYPFLIEPHLDLQVQERIWKGLFLLLGILIATAAWAFIKSTESASEIPRKAEVIPSSHKVRWFGIPCLLTILLMAVTQYLSHIVGSNPLAWTPPLSLFLIAYTLVFFGILPYRLLPYFLSAALLSLVCFTLHVAGLKLDGFPSKTLCLLATQALLSLALVMELFEHRPRQSFGRFYVATATGGALGGVFVSVVAPLIFNFEIELFLSMFISVFVLILVILRKMEQRPLALLSSALLILVMALGKPLWLLPETVEPLRNLYASIILQPIRGGIYLINGGIIHGFQYVDLEREDIPTTYYWEGSAIGQAIRKIQTDSDSVHIAVIGLGSGTLASYLRPADSLTFWEIDPNSIRVAESTFNFVSKSRGTVEIRQADGRKGLAASDAEYELIVVDAFSGDGIPPHLVTVEACREYLAKAPRGIVAFHSSNSHVDLARVLAGIARELDCGFIEIERDISPEDKASYTASPTIYSFLFPKDSIADWGQAFPRSLQETMGNAVTFRTEEDIEPILWTDERSAIWPILRK